LFCRENLQLYSCALQFKKVFPANQDLRKILFDVYGSTGRSLPPTFSMYDDPAAKLTSLPSPCQMYISSGCSFVMNMQITSKSKAQWTKYLNGTTEKIKNDYVGPISEAIRFVTHYTGIFSASEVQLLSSATNEPFLFRNTILPVLCNWTCHCVHSCDSGQLFSSSPIQTEPPTNEGGR
jgi:hypothetical protein